MTALDLARAVRIESVVRAREGKLKSQGKKWLIGPCLRSGGDDRFAINVTKQLWNCRHCDRGGDVIDLVAHLDDCTVGADSADSGQAFRLKADSESGRSRTAFR